MKYRHCKGGIYKLVCEAKLEADPSVTMMVYRSQADGAIWTRTKVVFFETVEHQGKRVPRFALLPEK
jgi:hypothetical protein